MTDDAPALDPDEKRTVTLTNAQIGNLMQCLDLMRRQCSFEQVADVLELAESIRAAKPIYIWTG